MPPSTEETTPPIPIPDDAAESAPITVDPGQPVRVTAWFPGTPPKFSYVAPGSAEATHDPGFGNPGSLIDHLGGEIYRCHIDTLGMGGEGGLWYATNDAEDVRERRVKLGRFNVREAPPSLLGLSTAPPPNEYSATNFVVGLDALGYERPLYQPNRSKIGTKWIKIGLAVKLATLIGYGIYRLAK